MRKDHLCSKLSASLWLVLGFMPLCGIQAAVLPPGFQESTVFSGHHQPTAVRFAPDGRVFVAEKSGLLYTYDDVDDASPSLVVDLRAQVHSFWDRGLLGLAVDPGYPARPYLYVLYAHDIFPDGSGPRWGTGGPNPSTDDPCPNPPGSTADGCVVYGRLSRLTVDLTTLVGSEEPLLSNQWCQQYPSHSMGDLAFGEDGYLYLSAGDGASFTFADWGQDGDPVNPCDDPPDGIGGPNNGPAAEGGSLRSLDIVTPADPTSWDGSILRLDVSGSQVLAPMDNPLVGHGVADDDFIVATGLRNPLRLALRPGSSEIWVGDVGWNQWEELNLVPSPLAPVESFGWPCYEGGTGGSLVQGSYAGQDLCQDVFADNLPPGVTTQAPFFAYLHTEQVIPGEVCGTGTSSITGLAFNTGNQYPPEFDEALFFADFSRRCIWAMPPGLSGRPDPSQRLALLADGQGGAVDLQIGPDGLLYYVDFDGGRVQRIEYFASNQPPTAVIAANPTEGPVPLVVQFDGSGSSDPEDGSQLSFAWDLNDDGLFDDSTLVDPLFSYNQAGLVDVHLRVEDTAGAQDTATVTITAGNTPPIPTILAPVASQTWEVDEVIDFVGQAVDPEDGTLPGSQLSWQVILHHCTHPNDCHTHDLTTLPGTESGSFGAPDHDFPSFLELRLTATDLDGLAATTEVFLNPRTVDLTFTSEPPGLQLSVGPETSVTPFTDTFIVSSRTTVAAPTVQSLGGTTYTFESWSDGGEASHLIVAPPTPETWTATYQETATLPTQGLVLHLESHPGQLLTHGDTVIQWLDASGFDNHLDAVGDPQRLPEALNGWDTVAFDGQGDRLEKVSGLSGLPGFNSDRTLFAVVHYQDEGFGGVTYGATDAAGPCNRAFGLVVDNHGDLTVQGWCLGNDFASNEVGEDAGWLVQSARLQADVLEHFRDGNLIDTQSHVFDTDPDGVLVLGAELDGHPHLRMELAAVLAYDRALSEAERLEVEDYLQQKYFTVVDLPPVAVDDFASVAPSGQTTIQVLANDTDDGSLDSASVTVLETTHHGSLTLDPLTGALDYQHDGSDHEEDSFTYTVDDDLGQTSNVATVTLTIAEGLPVLQGLVLHLETDAGQVLTTGNTVDQWLDASGFGNHLVATGDPQRLPAALQGHDVVRFDGQGDRLERLSGLNGLPGGASDRTLYAVVHYQDEGFGGVTYGATDSGGPCNRAFGLVVDNHGDLTVQGWCLGNDFPSDVAGENAGWLVQSARLQANGLEHFRDGTLIDIRSHVFDTAADGQLILGAELDGQPYLRMDLAAVLVYDRALSETERIQVEAYLQDKYFTMVDQPPHAMDDFAVVAPAGQVTIPVLANDTDDGTLDPASVIVPSPPTHGTLTHDPLTGDLFYQHSGTSEPQDTFTYTVSDDQGQTSNAATVHLSITDGLPVLQGLVLHLETDPGQVLIAGGDVMQWLDASGFGNHLTAAGDPEQILGALGGRDFLRFDGGDDRLERTSGLHALPGGNADRTLFAVLHYLDDGFGGVTYGSATCNSAFGLVVDNHGDLTVQGWCLGRDFATDWPGNGVGWLVQSARLSGDVLEHFLNGALIDTQTHVFATDANGLIRLGAELDGRPHLVMEIAAVLVYDRALSTEERQSVEDFLQEKYGLNGSGL